MKLTPMKRLILGAALALGVAGLAVTALPADQAAATEMPNCHPRRFTSDNRCVPQ